MKTSAIPMFTMGKRRVSADELESVKSEVRLVEKKSEFQAEKSENEIGLLRREVNVFHNEFDMFRDEMREFKTEMHEFQKETRNDFKSLRLWLIGMFATVVVGFLAIAIPLWLGIGGIA